jgi:hypothetical protein
MNTSKPVVVVQTTATSHEQLRSHEQSRVPQEVVRSVREYHSVAVRAGQQQGVVQSLATTQPRLPPIHTAARRFGQLSPTAEIQKTFTTTAQRKGA